MHAGRFVRDEIIGRGAYGSVYKCFDAVATRVVAVKILNLDTHEEEMREVINEISLLTQLRSPHITRYHGSFVHGTKLWIVMDYAAGGSIRGLLDAGPPFEERLIAYVARQTLTALDYLHKARIIHRDVKCANILVTGNGTIQLCDLGVAKEVAMSSLKRYSFVGTPLFIAPEVIKTGTAYDFKVDIWSFGIAIYEMATGAPPMAHMDPKRALMLIPQTAPPQLDTSFSALAREFLGQCLRHDPIQRPTADALMKHKFLAPATGSNKSGLGSEHLDDARELLNKRIAAKRSAAAAAAAGSLKSGGVAAAALLDITDGFSIFSMDDREDSEWDFGRSSFIEPQPPAAVHATPPPLPPPPPSQSRILPEQSSMGHGSASPDTSDAPGLPEFARLFDRSDGYSTLVASAAASPAHRAQITTATTSVNNTATVQTLTTATSASSTAHTVSTTALGPSPQLYTSSTISQQTALSPLQHAAPVIQSDIHSPQYLAEQSQQSLLRPPSTLATIDLSVPSKPALSHIPASATASASSTQHITIPFTLPPPPPPLSLHAHGSTSVTGSPRIDRVAPTSHASITTTAATAIASTLAPSLPLQVPSKTILPIPQFIPGFSLHQSPVAEKSRPSPLLQSPSTGVLPTIQDLAQMAFLPANQRQAPTQPSVALHTPAADLSRPSLDTSVASTASNGIHLPAERLSTKMEASPTPPPLAAQLQPVTANSVRPLGSSDSGMLTTQRRRHHGSLSQSIDRSIHSISPEAPPSVSSSSRSKSGNPTMRNAYSSQNSGTSSEPRTSSSHPQNSPESISRDHELLLKDLEATTSTLRQLFASLEHDLDVISGSLSL